MKHVLVVLFSGNMTSWCRLCACVKSGLVSCFFVHFCRMAVSARGCVVARQDVCLWASGDCLQYGGLSAKGYKGYLNIRL